jgi:hypothetical protein
VALASRQCHPNRIRPMRARCTARVAIARRGLAPEGHLRIAQRFIAGTSVGKVLPEVPKGRLKGTTDPRLQPSLRDSQIATLPIFPAVNCWAILNRPSGTAKPMSSCLVQRPMHFGARRGPLPATRSWDSCRWHRRRGIRHSLPQ